MEYSDEIIFTNKYGLITLKNETKINLEDKTNIIFMGDSFTQGAGVPYKNSFAGILTKKLEDQKKIINLSNNLGVKRFHIDVGDGKFINRLLNVENKVSYIKQQSHENIVHLHLMVWQLLGQF